MKILSSILVGLLLCGCNTNIKHINGYDVWVGPLKPVEWACKGKVCAWCGTTNNINIHHIYPQHLYPELKNDLNNQIPLCRLCHFVIGHKCNWNTGMTTNIIQCIKEGRR